MNKQEHLLTILGEEGCEIGQICSKINRFGIDEVNILQPNGPSNKYRLIEELNDLLGVAQILVEEGIWYFKIFIEKYCIFIEKSLHRL